MPKGHNSRRRNYHTTLPGKRMRKESPKPDQEDENDPATICGHIETDKCWCATAADNPGKSPTGGVRRNPPKSASIGKTISLNTSETKKLCDLAYYFQLGLKEVFRGRDVSACSKGLGVWDLVDRTRGESVSWLQHVMEFMVHRRRIKICPVDDGTIDKDPFPRIPQLKPVSDLVSEETVNLQEGTFDDRSSMGRRWFTHGFIPAFFKVLSLGTSDDRAMLAKIMKTPAQKRKLSVYTLLRMAVNVGDASLQPSAGTDHEADTHDAPTPMDIDNISSPPGMISSYSAVADESTTRQPSAPPDLTQRQRQASGGNDGEEYTYYGGNDGEEYVYYGGDSRSKHEATATHPARADIITGAVHGGTASLPAQGYVPAKPPGPPTTHTRTAEIYNEPKFESWEEKFEKMLLDLSLQVGNDRILTEARLDKQDRRQDDQDIRQNDQDIRLDKHDGRLDALEQDIKSMLKNHKDELADVKTILKDISERIPRNPGPLDAQTSSLNRSPAEFLGRPSNGAGPPPPPTDSRSRHRQQPNHGSDVRRHPSNTHMTRSMTKSAAHPAY